MNCPPFIKYLGGYAYALPTLHYCYWHGFIYFYIFFCCINQFHIEFKQFFMELYKRLGFRTKYEIENFYNSKTNPNAYYMEKRI